MKLKFILPLFMLFFLAMTLVVAAGARQLCNGASLFWSGLYWGGISLDVLGFVVATLLGRKFLRSLEQAQMTLGKFAEGDLSSRLAIGSKILELDSIARSVNSVGEAQCALVTELMEASQSMEREANSFQGAFVRIKGQSQRSREASGTVAAALEEMTVGVSSLTKEAQSVDVAARGACATSKRLNHMSFDASISVSRQYLALETTADILRKARESTIELEQSGKQISGMASAIMDVAKRTRLLALNASIEAERAGEKGRGFAVVAQEVKDLSLQSAQLAERIQGQVLAVSEGTERVSKDIADTETSLQESRRDAFRVLISVEQQSALSLESSESLDASSANMTEISRTLQESQGALDEINHSTRELDMRSRAVEAAIKGAEGGVGELARLAGSFEGTVKEMKVRPVFFPWNDELSVGVPRMDDQHKVLLRLINRLADLSDSGGGGASIRIVVGQLVDYTKFHFQDEEDLMESVGFPTLEEHRKVHQAFVAEVGRMVVKATREDSIDAASLLPVLKQWLIRHIQGTDKGYGSHILSRGKIA